VYSVLAGHQQERGHRGAREIEIFSRFSLEVPALSASLNTYLRSELALPLLRTFIARAIAALGSLGLMLVVGRSHGPQGVGVLALAQSLLLGAGLLSKSGMDNTLMRYVSLRRNYKEAFRYLGWALQRAIPAAILVATFLFMARTYFESIFSSPGLGEILFGISFSVPCYVFGYLLSGFFKGIRKPAAACLMENGAIALYAGGVLWLFLQYRAGLSASYSVIGYSYIAAAALVALQGGTQLWLWCRKQSCFPFNGVEMAAAGSPSIGRVQFAATSRAFFAATFAGFMQNVLAILLAGWLLSSSDLGLFKSAQQIGMVIAFILLVVNAVLPPRFASLYHNGNITALTRLARQGALLCGAVATPLVLICMFVPTWVLSWFGSGFHEAGPLLRIIAIAQLINVTTGSVGFLLNMTGHERLMRNIAITCNALGLLAFFFFISFFGAIGAAIALAFVLVCQNVVAMFFVWRKLGIWTLPCPNVFSLLGIRRP